MGNLQSFSVSTIVSLKYYVYALVNPNTNEICYVGKGKNQRVFESLKAKTTDKNQPQAYIIRHGLSEKEALMLEATLIDLLPFFAFSALPLNYQNGLDSKEIGIASIDDIESRYAAETINAKDFGHNVLIVSINRTVDLHDTLITPVKLYECTRKAWRVNPDKTKQIEYVIAKHNGILKEIYKPTNWYEYSIENNFKRYAFEGDIVIDSKIRDLYLNKKIDKRSWGSPLTYIINKDITTSD